MYLPGFLICHQHQQCVMNRLMGDNFLVGKDAFSTMSSGFDGKKEYLFDGGGLGDGGDDGGKHKVDFGRGSVK